MSNPTLADLVNQHIPTIRKILMELNIVNFQNYKKLMDEVGISSTRIGRNGSTKRNGATNGSSRRGGNMRGNKQDGYVTQVPPPPPQQQQQQQQQQYFVQGISNPPASLQQGQHSPIKPQLQQQQQQQQRLGSPPFQNRYIPMPQAPCNIIMLHHKCI